MQVIEASDVVLEVLDARDPMGCRCPQLEQAIACSGGEKKLLLVLNKIGKKQIFLKFYFSHWVVLFEVSCEEIYKEI